jgi:hypothetical protein
LDTPSGSLPALRAPPLGLRERDGLVEVPDLSIRDRGDLLAPSALQLESRLVEIRDMPSARLSSPAGR